MTLTITEQDKKLLELIAQGESNGSYTAVNGVTGGVTQLTSMTVPQVIAYSRVVGGDKSTPETGAAGKYQFIPGTLSGIFKKSGLPDTTIFSADVQDYLIVEVIKGRGLDNWKSGGLPDDKFMIYLSAEFASIPVPYFVAAGSVYPKSKPPQPTGDRKKGESFYQGSSGNRALHDPDDFLQKLADIRTGGAGSTITLSQDAATAPNGNLPMTQAEVAAGGGQRLRGGQGTAYASALPAVSDPYFYVPIAAENNRYDFRTGKKVTDILVNGTNPASNAGLTANNGRAPVADSGRAAYTPDQLLALSKNKISIGYGTGQVDPALARAVGLKFGEGTTLSTTVSGATSAGSKSLPVAKSNAQ